MSRQRGRGFGALPQVIGRTAIPFLRKNIVPAAKCMNADLLQFAAPEIAEAVSGGQKFKTAATNVGRQTLRKQFGSGSRKKTSHCHSNKVCKTNQQRLFLHTFLTYHVK